jgi:ankyrin repeat protein
VKEAALIHAAAAASVNVVRLLLEHDADPNASVGWAGGSLLHEVTNPTKSQARGRDVVGILQLLLEHGADPNLQDCEGKTPLHYLVEDLNSLSENELDTVREALESLLEHGADPNKPTGDSLGDWRALTMLVGGSKLHPQLLRILLEYGADTSLVHMSPDPSMQDSVRRLCDELSQSTGRRFEFLPPCN